MPDVRALPPSVTVGPTQVAVSLLTADGAMVEISLPRLKGLAAVPPEEIAARAQTLAREALEAAARNLPG